VFIAKSFGLDILTLLNSQLPNELSIWSGMSENINSSIILRGPVIYYFIRKRGFSPFIEIEQG